MTTSGEDGRSPGATPASALSSWRFTRAGSASAVLTDGLVWIVALALATIGRYDFDLATVRWAGVAVVGLFLAGLQLMLGGLVLLYQGRFQVGSFDELRALTVSATATAAAGSLLVLTLDTPTIPRSVTFLAWPLALGGMCGVRYFKRLIRQASNTPGRDAERLLIFGAGWVGSALVLRMLRDPSSRFRPVGFLDDDPLKGNLQLHGIRVLGRGEDLASAARAVGAKRVVVAVNQADAALIRRISDAADAAGIGCLVMPPLNEMLGTAQVRLSTLREVNVEDLIGRRPVETDVRAIAQYVSGKRVLVTGAGGSIGSELCRQLHKFGPAELIMLDRDESALHAVELSIHGHGLLNSERTVLVDIRDAEALTRAVASHQPHVVFHAAALKHLPLLEQYPLEALKTNVYGTLNVLEAAYQAGAGHVVNISTDKAANPESALGHSKRMAELLTAWFATRPDAGKFLSVRFGNVLGSRGSVLHAFAAQIEGGGPVTVTDPEVTRYFMTIPEACQLVIQAGAIGRPGEALVLDMGEPVRICDVAQRMIDRSGKDVEIVYTGLRQGEKLHEDLFGVAEQDTRPLHPLISHVSVPPLSPALIEEQPWAASAAVSGVPVGHLAVQQPNAGS